MRAYSSRERATPADSVIEFHELVTQTPGILAPSRGRLVPARGAGAGVAGDVSWIHAGWLPLPLRQGSANPLDARLTSYHNIDYDTGTIAAWKTSFYWWLRSAADCAVNTVADVDGSRGGVVRTGFWSNVGVSNYREI